jgi:hypothetical protein
VPRIPRGQQGDYVYHIIDPGNRRATVFHKSQDYEAFLSLLSEAKTRHCALPAVIFTPWQSLLPYPSADKEAKHRGKVPRSKADRNSAGTRSKRRKTDLSSSGSEMKARKTPLFPIRTFSRRKLS